MAQSLDDVLSALTPEQRARVEARAQELIEEALAFPVHRRNFVRQSDIAFVNKQLENTRKNRSFGENPWQRCSKTQNVGKSLSSCHLTKQRLINSLAAEVDESARLIESTGVTPPYKISRFHRESH